MTYRSERFDPERHDVRGFSCGEASLDTWLREQAVPATDRRTARTWVWVDQGGVVGAYYALAAHKVAREAVPVRVGRGGPAEIPAVLLARLALSEPLRGQGLGEVLVADALARVVDATQTVAARLVVVDALHERVARFYESLGFRRIPGSLLLVQKLTDIEAALRKPE
ncbi:MAG: GNAT family N-acetyltransferase [Actinomycetota bacterium]|nr:GNAT family N-acetyltransferase [Actinomycetota bacterium]